MRGETEKKFTQEDMTNMTNTDSDLGDLLAMLDRGRQSWIEGALGVGQGLDIDQDDDFTILGPFGGEPGRGPGLKERQKAAAKLFHGGRGSLDVVKTIVAGEIAVVVLVERNEAVVEDGAAPQPWVLRTTQVFERRPSGWVRLHRHADPLIDLRNPAATFALARGESPSA
jgi:hypothetical protein